ncbi:MAG: MFS transporter, partial [Oscillospiraceae bacterium]|nr:MFS transporter [Oscillospiraceae bacterium]
MTKQYGKKALMRTVFLISFLQMPQFAILPATNLIATEIFPEIALRTIQTVMSLPGIVAVFAGISSTVMIRCGFASKKGMTLFGLMMIALTGAVAALLHTRFWQLCLMNTLIGVGMGIFVPSLQSIMFDNFEEKTRQFISGVSFSCINGGGLIMSMTCGLLTTVIWYGGAFAKL